MLMLVEDYTFMHAHHYFILPNSTLYIVYIQIHSKNTGSAKFLTIMSYQFSQFDVW